jgi:hypothetical protein
LLFQPFVGRHVAKQAQQQWWLSAQFHEGIGILEDHRVPVVQGQTAFRVTFDGAVTKPFAIPVEDPLALVGVRINHRQWLAFQVVSFQAHQTAVGVVDRDDCSVLIGQAHAVNRVFPHGME